MERPLLGIMTSSQEAKDNYSEYFTANKNLNESIFIFRPGNIRWKAKKIEGMFYQDGWKSRLFSFPKAVYNRYYSSRPFMIDKLEKHIGARKCFNRITKFDKWEIHTILKKSVIGQHLPDTFKYSPDKLLELLKKYNHVLIKDAKGTLGKNIYWIERTPTGTYLVYQDNLFPKFTFDKERLLLRKLKELLRSRPYILQRKIALSHINDRRVDYRVMVQKNIRGQWEVTASLARMTYKNYFVTNIIKNIDLIENVLPQISYTPQMIAQTIHRIQHICMDAARLLENKKGHIGELGFDIALDENGQIWILEVNGNPSKKLFEPLSDEANILEIYKKPIEYASFLTRSKARVSKRV